MTTFFNMLRGATCSLYTIQTILLYTILYSTLLNNYHYTTLQYNYYYKTLPRRRAAPAARPTRAWSRLPLRPRPPPRPHRRPQGPPPPPSRSRRVPRRAAGRLSRPSGRGGECGGECGGESGRRVWRRVAEPEPSRDVRALSETASGVGASVERSPNATHWPQAARRRERSGRARAERSRRASRRGGRSAPGNACAASVDHPVKLGLAHGRLAARQALKVVAVPVRVVVLSQCAGALEACVAGPAKVAAVLRAAPTVRRVCRGARSPGRGAALRHEPADDLALLHQPVDVRLVQGQQRDEPLLRAHGRHDQDGRELAAGVDLLKKSPPEFKMSARPTLWPSVLGSADARVARARSYSRYTSQHHQDRRIVIDGGENAVRMPSTRAAQPQASFEPAMTAPANPHEGTQISRAARVVIGPLGRRTPNVCHVRS